MGFPETASPFPAEVQGSASNRALPLYRFYLPLLAVAIFIWLLPVRAGLSVDETGSYWQISAGFSQIWSRGLIALCFPAYTYILWLWTRVAGTSEIALRSLSLIAMLSVVYLLYLAARELFKPDAALFAAITFCIHPIVAYAAIDVRPYAFGVLSATAAILVLLRLRNNDSNWMAALFGLFAAGAVYFHYFFATILPAFAICFFLVKEGDRKVAWRQFGIAAAVILVTFLPLIPGIEEMFRTRGSHVYEKAPGLKDVFQTLVPWIRRPIFVSVAALLALLGVIKRKSALRDRVRWHVASRQLLICASLAFVPLLILYAVSVGTSIHTFAPRHRLIVIPGVALCWGFLISLFPRPLWRLLFCVAAVASTAYYQVRMPDSRHHLGTWRDVVPVIEKNVPNDGGPVMICSDFSESNHMVMPVDSPNDSPLFAPLKYYGFNTLFVPLPQHFNDETIRVASPFLGKATQNHERFTAAQEGAPYETLQWLMKSTAGSYDAHDLGVYDGIKVMEFVPKETTTASH